MNVKVQIVQSVLRPLGHDEAFNRIAVVYVDQEEYRVSAPAKASGPAIEWLGNAFVRQPDTTDFGSELVVPPERAKIILKLVKDELEKRERSPEAMPARAASTSASRLPALKVVCSRFHEVVKQLRIRHGGRKPLEIQDEYDVQYLLHALLRIFFDDVRSEEWTPSYAGSAARMDFLLPDEEAVLEVKKTRDGLGAKEVGEQLIVDIAKYQGHPKCKRLLCFIYDPDGRISNPRGLEKDLSKKHGDLEVEVIVVPR